MLRLIGALLLLAGLATGALYYGTELWGPKIDKQIDAWTKWTPENITKDPKGYLTFALAELEKIDTRLKGHRLELQVALDTNEVKVKEAARRADASATVLAKLKDVYRVSANAFPVAYDDRDYSESQFQDLVVSTDLYLEQARADADMYDKYVTHLKGELDRTDRELKNLTEKRLFVQQQLQRVTLDLAIGASNDLTAKAEEIAATAKALRGESSKAASEATFLIKHEEKKLQNQSVKDRFAQIMASK